MEDLLAVLEAGPGTAAWSDEREAVNDAIIDAGKVGHRELEAHVLPYLAHPYEELRKSAIRTLAGYWALPAYRDFAHSMSKTDPDFDVRATALAAWAGYYADTNNAKVMLELDTRLRNKNEPTLVRNEAYRSLLDVSGYLSRVDPRTISRLLDVFDNVDGLVDWGLVDRLVGSARASQDDAPPLL